MTLFARREYFSRGIADVIIFTACILRVPHTTVAGLFSAAVRRRSALLMVSSHYIRSRKTNVNFTRGKESY
jgi:hypothetical protein